MANGLKIVSICFFLIISNILIKQKMLEMSL